MEDNEPQQMRYSCWPDQNLPVPKVVVWDADLENGDVCYHLQGDSGSHPYEHGRYVDLPPELYLREVMDLDPLNEDAVLEFVRTYGMVGSVIQSWDRRPSRMHLLGSYFGLTDYPDADLDLLPGIIANEARKCEADKLVTRKRVAGGCVQTLEMIRLHLRTIRDAVRLYQVLTGQMAYEDLIDYWQLPRVAGVLPPTEESILVVLAEILNAGLTSFSARIELFSAESGPASHIALTNLYPALCLQFFNHIQEDAIYGRCRNEKCGRLFVRQRGRAEKGRYHTTGVMYCSDYCARAQGQRELRRRKAAAKKIGKGAKS